MQVAKTYLILFLGVNPDLLDTLLYPDIDEPSKTTSTSNANQEATSSDEADEVIRCEKKKLDSLNTLFISKLLIIANFSCKPGEFYFVLFFNTVVKVI